MLQGGNFVEQIAPCRRRQAGSPKAPLTLACGGVGGKLSRVIASKLRNPASLRSQLRGASRLAASAGRSLAVRDFRFVDFI